MIVRDVMKGEVCSISPSARLEDAWIALSEHKVQYIVVMEGTKIEGILSKNDLVELTEEARNSLSVKDKMTKTVECVSADSNLKDAVQTIKQYRLECLPVCQNDTLVGIILLQDLQKIFQRI